MSLINKLRNIITIAFCALSFSFVVFLLIQLIGNYPPKTMGLGISP